MRTRGEICLWHANGRCKCNITDPSGMDLQRHFFHPNVLLLTRYKFMEGERDIYSKFQILTTLSQPPVASLIEWALRSGCVERRFPGTIAGAQLTALQPIPCALNTLVSQLPSSLNSRTETLPSLEAQASNAPSS